MTLRNQKMDVMWLFRPIFPPRMIRAAGRRKEDGEATF